MISKKRIVVKACILGALAAGTLYVPTMAEGTITSPVTVTNPNQSIEDNISIINGSSPRAVSISKAASGGKININSKEIAVSDNGNNGFASGLIHVNVGYTGNVYLADGMNITGTFSGTQVEAEGLSLWDTEKLSERNTTGLPVNGNVFLGQNITIRMENQNKNNDDNHPVTENYLYGAFVAGETMKAGNNLTIDVKAHTGNDALMSAVGVFHYGSVSIGDNADLSLENHAKGALISNMTDVIFSDLQFKGESKVNPIGKNKLKLGKNAKITGIYTSEDDAQMTSQEFFGLRLENTDASIDDGIQIVLTGSGSSQTVGGTGIRQNSNVSYKDSALTQITMDGNAQYIYGWYAGESSVLNVGKSAVTNIQGSGSASYIYNVDAQTGSHIAFDNGGVAKISFNGSTTGLLGWYVNKSSLNIGDNSYTEILGNGDRFQNTYVRGIMNNGGAVEIGNGAQVKVIARNTKSSSSTASSIGIYNSAQMTAGDSLQIEVNASDYQSTRGLYTSGNGSTFSIGNNFSILASAERNHNNTGPDIAGLWAQNSAAVSIGSHSRIHVSASSGATRAMGIYTGSKTTTTLGDDASVVVNSDAENNNHVLHTQGGGTLTFAGSAYIQGNQEAAWSVGEGSQISLMGSGKKTVLGNLVSKNKGTILLDLSTSDSLLRGKSSVRDSSDNEDVNAADTELSLSNGAKWQMSDTSYVTRLTNNDGIVDMQYNQNYQNLYVGTFSGNNGLFLMKSDLDSQNDGDKVTIDNAAAGSSGLISVYDKSLATGKEVTGTRHLLMVTDNSRNATFTGKSLDTGGLWDVTPSIHEGGTFADGKGNTIGKSGEWYLAKLTKTINKDTKPVIEAGDNTYGLYRLSIDTLRQRLGDLRYRNRSDDKYDFWVRDRHGRFDGNGYDSKYNFLQVGVDTMPNEKSAYGFLVERGIASPNFDTGSGKNHTLAGALYATWIGDHGNYTDIVAKIGRNDTTLHTYGAYADKASYREDEKSLSFEYGRTLDMGDKGYFFEPQAQIVFGHLGSNNYTTRRGTHVHEDSFDSAIGRLGFVLGKKQKNGENPHDFYFKASVLHEFGGDRDYSLRRMNAYGDEESLDGSYNYRDTWYEVGFGGNVKINNNTSFYADVERSFGSDYTKKWQINAGINWSF